MLSSSFSSLKMFHVFGSHRRLLPSIKSRISCFLRQKSAFSRAPKRVLSDDGRDYDQAVLGLPPEPSKIIGTQPKFPARNSAKSSRKRTATDYKFMNTVISITSKSRKSNKDNLVLLEGVRLIQDACEAGAEILQIYYSDQHKLVDYPEILRVADDRIPIIKVDRGDYNLVSKQVTPQGFMAICKKPGDELLEKVSQSSLNQLVPLHVVADSFSDPGNLGALVRSSAAVGASRLICSNRCAYVWDPKVMRSGSGAHFRLPIHHDLDWQSIHNYLMNVNARLFYAEAADGDRSFHDFNFFSETSRSPLALLVGSETGGFQSDAQNLIQSMNGQRLSIPLSRGVESLNNHVAAAVIMYEMKRQYSMINC